MYSVVRRVTRKGDTPVAYLLLNPHSQTNEGISRNPYEVPTFIAPIHFNAGRFPPVVYKDIYAGATMQTAVIFLQAKPHIHTVRLRIMYQNTLLHSETSLHFEFRQFSGIIYKVCFEVKSPCLSVYSGDISV